MSLVNIYGTCRICLEREGSFRSIFSKNDDFNVNASFAEMIMSSSSVKISINDGLPEDICLNCSNKVLEAYKLKLKIEENDLFLRSEFKYLDENNGYCAGSSSINNIVKIEDPIEIPHEDELLNFKDDISNPELMENAFIIHPDKLKLTTDNGLGEISKRYYCKICNSPTAYFIQKDSYEKHLKIHENVKMYKCTMCRIPFTSQKTLQSHSKIHVGDMEWEKLHGGVCKLSNSNMNSLLEHTCEIHKDLLLASNHGSKKVKVCAYMLCNARFNTVKELQRHVYSIHTQRKNFTCNICKYTSMTAAALKIHIKLNHL